MTMKAEIRKLQANDDFVLFYVDESLFAQAIEVYGGKIYCDYKKGGVAIAWEYKVPEDKKDDVIVLLRNLKKTVMDGKNNG